ncbi:hypothetical protein ACFQFC_04945 [Amorphoplanes digitatis]|uniref:Uncharacterized protein n=1 Tax=Actinoplanes digitatis TaxID=1868 RepID=A0A7W7MQS5_9ACTN|nr:hypothetical protein [Actinoplanes digitatis]MBB4763536.1 hypothetical protein [Actinoplanes digitatis]GID93207.1 hypothetical protein Adi01nite_26190 [Actinoplanes digitatis]
MRSLRRLRTGGVLALTAALALALTGGAAQAGPAADQGAPKLPGRTAAATPGVSTTTPAKGVHTEKGRSLAGTPAGQGITLGKPRTGPAPRMVNAGPDDPPGTGPVCVPYISRLVTPNGTAFSRVDYLAEVLCNFYLAGAGQAYLIDRTGGVGTSNQVIAAAPVFQFYNSYYGGSQGAVLIDGRLFDGGRVLEIGFDLILQTLNGAPWGGCFALAAPQRYLSACNGLGTPTLQVSVGSGEFGSGLPAYNPAAFIRDIPGIGLLDFHVGKQVDPPSTARQNIVDVANGQPARTSTFSDVGRTDVTLRRAMLDAILRIHLVNGLSFRITAIAGSDHSSNSPHYFGRAFDIDRINNNPVNTSNSLNQTFRNACAAYGATDIRGPGDDADHATHIHCAWN